MATYPEAERSMMHRILFLLLSLGLGPLANAAPDEERSIPFLPSPSEGRSFSPSVMICNLDDHPYFDIVTWMPETQDAGFRDHYGNYHYGDMTRAAKDPGIDPQNLRFDIARGGSFYSRIEVLIEPQFDGFSIFGVGYSRENHAQHITMVWPEYRSACQ
ncbi:MULTISPECIES: hypothetical protein [unclassified Thioalkalivibrio]|uniref:hypothetical protein n=1 Tax=unclassified Thioalkalivibrio TaxID=2621013 RepID=UPI001E2CF3AD|nr:MULTISPECIES: hypothetical protein [unclassified Thioalkalivibrio]